MLWPDTNPHKDGSLFCGFVRLQLRVSSVASENVADGVFRHRQTIQRLQFIFQPDRSIAGLFSQLQDPGFNPGTRFVVYPVWRF